ncbi:5-formyltetrahydrofolate cyclo-ligase [Avibacterium gallinarum]|uniref:5-formyltetrahydrofolate cyclo-ligase n=2 Tax=Avibacterium TaxID=292486 RepID=A0A379AZU2_AVIGA|nr:5-formyltetrahydrofolate cyclo-ligase [Avibacterium gallinarum]TDP29215.1 5-formyltetrahydrofolate cyclo-ligase [Avibacterium gallinarum]SUB28288.1 putative 5-formyltetrahydrofolate cyclo-ligase-family protein [Avibacterium gallinarum]
MNLTTRNQQRQIIRQQIRQLRQSLSPAEQNLAEQKITQQALDFIEKKQAKHVGLYLSFDGEISTKQLIQQLWKKNIAVYLPILHPFSANNLLFLRYHPNSPLQKNKFGILEPKLDVRNVLPTNELDIIFTPLVAFDKQGNRLGMGGGFYDRTLQNWQQKNFLPIGLAHQCQQVDALPVESWDIPLFGVLVG